MLRPEIKTAKRSEMCAAVHMATTKSIVAGHSDKEIKDAIVNSGGLANFQVKYVGKPGKSFLIPHSSIPMDILQQWKQCEHFILEICFICYSSSVIHQLSPAAQGATSDTTASECDDIMSFQPDSEACLFSPSPPPKSHSEEQLYQNFRKDCRKLRYSDFVIVRNEGNGIVTVSCFAHYLFVSVDLHADGSDDDEIERPAVNDQSESNGIVTVSCFAHYLFVSVDLHADGSDDDEIERPAVNDQSRTGT